MLQTVIMECQVAFSRVCGTSLRGQGVINTMCYEEVRASYKDELSHEGNVIPVREGVVRKYNIIVIDECSIFVSCLHLIGTLLTARRYHTNTVAIRRGTHKCKKAITL